MPAIDKLVLSVKAPLKEKYEGDFAEVESLLTSLVNADKQKGLNTKIIFLDDSRNMRSLKIRAITEKSTEKDFKNCIDALYKKIDPDYILLFGSIDIIPQQKLKNLLYAPKDDDDQWVPSDLPYACNEPYSTDPNKFLTPVRVVGRLPDINSVNDMDLVSNMINNTIAFKSKSKQDYLGNFSASAHVWRVSTEQSMKSIFSKSRLRLIPPTKYHWKRTELKPLSHFFNCHGASSDPHWYGQQGGRYPKAMASIVLQEKIQKDTIVAAECCYGAQLYHPPQDELPESMPICNAYFKNGAIAFLGSSTIAYGPSTTNDQADLITQYFFIGILSGASTGRALLEARQKYILNHGPDMSPVDLKTLSQFNLLGDPSLHIVTGEVQKEKKAVGIIKSKPLSDSARKELRKYLLSKGVSLGSFVNKVESSDKFAAGKKSRTEIKRLITELKLKSPTGTTFSIKQNKENKKAFRSNGLSLTKYHVFIEKKEPNSFKQKLLGVKELNGEIVNVQLYVRK